LRSVCGETLLTELHKSQTNQRRSDSYDCEKRWIERGKLLLEGLTLIAVVSYGIVAYVQWRAMLVANDQVERALEVGQGTHVFVSSVEADSAQIGSKLTGQIQLVNTGNLAARNVIFEAMLQMYSECPTGFAGEMNNPPEFDMPPNLSSFADQPPETVNSQQPLSKDDFDGFTRGTKKLCAYGAIEYWTGFLDSIGRQKVTLQPFCQWTDKTYHFQRCQGLNTEYKIHHQVQEE
jgi:hypothetical protein